MTERFGSTNDVFGTGDVFLDLFAYGNQNLNENKEAVWVAQFAANLSDGGGKITVLAVMVPVIIL